MERSAFAKDAFYISTDNNLWCLFDFETFRRGTNYIEAHKML